MFEASHRRSHDSTVSGEDSVLGGSMDDSRVSSFVDTRPHSLPEMESLGVTESMALNIEDIGSTYDPQNPNKFLTMLNRDSGLESSSVGSGTDAKPSNLPSGYASSPSLSDKRRRNATSARHRREGITEREVPVSFIIVRISPSKPPCISVRLAFLGGTSGVVRQRVSIV